MSEASKGAGFAEAARAALLQWTFQAGRPGDFHATMVFVYDAACTEPRPLPPLMFSRIDRAHYPDEAARRRIEGEVLLAVYVDAKGKAVQIRLISETPGGFAFAKYAMGAIVQWRFEWTGPAASGFTSSSSSRDRGPPGRLVAGRRPVMPVIAC